MNRENLLDKKRLEFEERSNLIKKVEELNNSTPNGQIVDADTILADMVEKADFEISGIAQDIMNVWKNSRDKKSVEDIFYLFTDIKFKEYLEYCIEEMTKQQDTQNVEKE